METVTDMRSAKTLYLHIGLGKTGTSSLQAFFARNVSQLSRHGIWYPATGRNELNAHHYLSTAARPGGGTGFDTDVDWGTYLEQLRQELSTRSEENILISSEVFSGIMIWRLLAALKGLFAEIRVIAYLRRQDILIASNYNQWVKTENLRLKFDEMRLLPFDFEKMLEPWQLLLNDHDGEIIARPYEPSGLLNGSIIDDFMDAVFNIEIDERFLLAGEARSNTRLSLDALEFKRLANELCPIEITSRFIEPLVEYSRNALALEPESETALLSSQDQVEILAAFRESNASVANNYLNRADGVLFDEPVEAELDGQSNFGLGFPKALEISRFVVATHLQQAGTESGGAMNSPDVERLMRRITWPCGFLARLMPDRALRLLIKRLATTLYGRFEEPTNIDVVGNRWAKS